MINARDNFHSHSHPPCQPNQSGKHFPQRMNVHSGLENGFDVAYSRKKCQRQIHGQKRSRTTHRHCWYRRQDREEFLHRQQFNHLSAIQTFNLRLVARSMKFHDLLVKITYEHVHLDQICTFWCIEGRVNNIKCNILWREIHSYSIAEGHGMDSWMIKITDKHFTSSWTEIRRGLQVLL